MSDKEISKKVIRILSMVTEAEEISEDSELMEDLEISSMDILFLISSLEEEFQITIPEKFVRKIVTVEDVVNIVTDLMG